MASLTETGERINAHLKRFEADKEINTTRKFGLSSMATHIYYNAWAGRTGRFVGVRYIIYQDGDSLTRAEAERYLAWLDAGNVGTHWQSLRS